MAHRKKTDDALHTKESFSSAVPSGDKSDAMSFHRDRCSTLLGLLLLLFVAGCATAPKEYREPPVLEASARASRNLQVFERTWELVNKRYFDAHFRGTDWPAMRTKYRPEAVAAPDDAALYRVLNSMSAELKESHLAALSPRRAHEVSTEYRASVGFRWQQLEGRRVINDVLPGSPAAAAGLQPGWLVLTRNGAPVADTEGYTPKLGRSVTYGFIDARDEPRTLTLEPQLLNFDRLEQRELPEGCLYLRFDVFSRKSLSWLSEQLKAHASAPGVVIDLRYNSGGNLLALNVALAEFFPHPVTSGHMVKRNGRETESQSVAWRSARYRGRVVILTDRATASAAEIFSHVLQYHQRATVIGRPTAGAVIASRNYPLPDGGRLQVPVTDYVGLDGRRLEGRGVAPDLALPGRSRDDLRAGRDPDLEAAIRALQRSDRLPPA